MFYQKCCEYNSIGASVRSQTHENGKSDRRWPPTPAVSFREFAAKLFVQSSQTQNQSCREFKELSTGHKYIDISLKNVQVYGEFHRVVTQKSVKFHQENSFKMRRNTSD